MSKFDKTGANELRELLYDSYVHDAELKNIECERGKDRIKMELVNSIFNQKIELTFINVGLVFATKGKAYGNRETVISLTVEEDYSYLQNYVPNCSEGLDDSLYLLFQMLSGDELHIVSKEVIAEVTR